jgi:hypothetical protein
MKPAALSAVLSACADPRQYADANRALRSTTWNIHPVLGAHDQSGQVIAIFELSADFIGDEQAVVKEKKELSRRLSRSSLFDYGSSGLRSLDIAARISRACRDKTYRPIDLWRRQLTKYR